VQSATTEGRLGGTRAGGWPVLNACGAGEARLDGLEALLALGSCRQRQETASVAPMLPECCACRLLLAVGRAGGRPVSATHVEVGAHEHDLALQVSLGQVAHCEQGKAEQSNDSKERAEPCVGADAGGSRSPAGRWALGGSAAREHGAGIGDR
jgi:hypothetical protein